MTDGTINLNPAQGNARLALTVAMAALFALILAALVRLGLAPDRVVPSRYVREPWLALHLISVVPAVPLGAYLLIRRKGDQTHRMLGRVWALLMLGAALSSFGLTGLRSGSFSPIHLLSILVLVSVPRAIVNARRGRIAAHRRSMTLIYLSLLAAGVFAFAPGRLMWLWLAG